MLTRHPFDKEVSADELFPSEAHAELGTRLRHLIEMRGIGLVTGDSGSGKTTTCRKLVSELHTGLHRVLYVSMTTGNAMDLYKSIAWGQIRSEVSRLCSENRLRPILIVDEAHHLRTELLEELRLLTNYAMDSENRLTVVLVGHPELRRRMGLAALEALAHVRVVVRAHVRVVVRAHVRGLTREEVGPYLSHRLRLAGTLRSGDRSDLPRNERHLTQDERPRASCLDRCGDREGEEHVQAALAEIA